MIGFIPTCCNNSVGAQIGSTTCNIRYEIYPFFQISSSSPPPPPPPPVQGSPPQFNSGTGNGKSVNVVAIVVPVTVAAWRLWEEGSVLELIEPTLRECYSRNEVMRCIHISLLCVQEDVARRPTMASVVLMLNNYSVTFPLPTAHAFFVGRSRKELGWKTGERGPNTNDSSQLVLPNQSISSFISESVTELYPR
ncbi:hypothetical protein IFM89_032719 [Coptis chinensis]|uniref:Uncharacterized protein n=1 Tax=Coptis chinensis TaxID=261450 RepID=A0A835M7S3_9MAGN|nr:hypothetical protein IFM89_032719 [Coptis chinensis]